MQKRRKKLIAGLLHHLMVCLGAISLALAFFLVLPLMQVISKPPESDLTLRSANTITDKPPPPIQEEEKKEEPEEEEKPPELAEDTQLLDLSQLEVALNPGFSQSWTSGNVEARIKAAISGGSNVDKLFSMAELDQKPRVIYQPSPVMTKAIKKHAPGKVYIIFIVNKRGRVERAMVQKSSGPIFEKSALAAVSKWKFEPGKRNGKPVRFRMRVPITFPKE